ncbi:MAG TPA: RNA degradosome polyphosphate kinase, partial [Opitutus sp.]|nr:RNA degradosome polyphosphate kinase [Opitutus sp.]
MKRVKKYNRLTAATGKSIARPANNQGIRPQYANREQSWLNFNRRVLEQAQSEANPLLERAKFLAIVSSNLDEFFEIRVAGLIQQTDAGTGELSLDGLTPREQLKRVHNEANALVDEQYRCWHEQLVPALAKQNIVFRAAPQLTDPEAAWVRHYFRTQVLPILTPLAVDQAHPFPQIVNKTLNVLLSLDNPDTPETEKTVVILPVPRILPRIVQIEPDGDGAERYIFLSEIIKLC